MVRKIIQVSDLHIHKTMDNWENEMYATQLGIFLEKCQEIAQNYEYDEVRIVICGDLFHNKNNISNDMDIMASNFIRNLETIAPIRIIAGNHDFNKNNINQTHTISTFIETHNFNNTLFLDEITNYHSGFIEDDNITWVLYSAFDNFIKPDLTKYKIEHKDKFFVGLYHDDIVGAKYNNGLEVECGLDGSAFEECDCVMAGHIHKRQALRIKGVDIVYSGSLIQQDFGETTTQHGFCLWDVETQSHEFIDIPSDYGFYEIEVDCLEDIDNNKIQITNL